MERKLLVLDIDGTLVDSSKAITPGVRDAIHEMLSAGHQVCLASGRPTPGIRHVASALELNKRGGLALNFNGALVTDLKSGEVVYEKKVARKFVRELYDFACEKDLGILTYARDIGRTGDYPKSEAPLVIFGRRPDPYLEDEANLNDLPWVLADDFVGAIDYDPYKILFTMDPSRGEELENELASRYPGVLNIMRSEPYFLEACPLGIDKGACLDLLVPSLGFTRENTICCGDGFNDLTMVKWAGLGVAMGNAQQVVKDVAKYIAPSNDEDGVAHVIRKFIL